MSDRAGTHQASVHNATAVSAKERISEMKSEFADVNRASNVQPVNNHVLTELSRIPCQTGNDVEARSDFIIKYQWYRRAIHSNNVA